MIPRTKATLITGSQEFSGSIERIQALATPSSDLHSMTCSLSRIEFGNKNGNSQANYTASAIVDPSASGFPFDRIDVLSGNEILGPITRLKSSGSYSRWLIYHD